VEIYDEPSLRGFYDQNGRYRVFVHQAVLSGVILSELGTDEILELPPTYNYPLQLHGKDMTENRPASIEKLVTMRHEEFYSDPRWFEKMPAGDSLKRWLVERLAR